MKNTLFFKIAALSAVLSVIVCSSIMAQLAPSTGSGVSVSPSHLHFSVGPGGSKTYKIKINNDTDRPNKFAVKMNDFNMNGRGKSSFIPPGEGKYSLSKYLTVSPTFIDLAPGEVKEVAVTLSLSGKEQAAFKAAWSVLMIEQVEERKALDPGRGDGKTIAMGVIPTFAFGVFMYQNPPNVEINKVEIIGFKYLEEEAKRSVKIGVKNIGDGVSYCTSYVELTNLNNGEQHKLHVKNFTIVPELIRDFDFDLPEDLSAGKYSAAAVLDFGSDEEIEVAELEFQIE